MKTPKMFLALALLALCAACGKESKTEVVLAGSTSVQPFAEMLAEQYMAQHRELSVVVQGGGSTAGVQAVREGAATIGMVSRELSKQENDLTPIVIARDGIALVVHPGNPVADLTLDQARAIFSNRVRDWRELGGRPGRIWPVTREEGSGTRGAFQELVMHKEIISPRAMVQDSNGSVRAVIAHDPNGIGYISLGLVDSSVKALRIGGVVPSREHVKDKSYSLVRPFLFTVKDPPHGIAKDFIDYVLGAEGQKTLEDEGLIGAQ